jgi:hypothetical protein
MMNINIKEEGKMVNKIIIGTACACLAALSFNGNAAIITRGYLTTNDDGSTNIITDSLNNVEYLRLDVLADLNYAQTLTVLATQDGGGWSIANASDAIKFTNALTSGASRCRHDGTNVIQSFCGSVFQWAEGDLGENYTEFSDLAWFLDDSGEADYIQITNLRDLYIFDSTMAGSDEFSATGSQSDIAVSWLVVRPAVVPIPTAFWLFGSGLIGLVGVARRKKS